MMTVVDTLVEGFLHVSPAPHLNVAARGIPEPLEGVLETALNPLSPKVAGHVRLHRFEELDLVLVQILQRPFCGRRGQLGHDHIPGVVKSLNVVPTQPGTLEVVEVVKHLAALT